MNAFSSRALARIVDYFEFSSAADRTRASNTVDATLLQKINQHQEFLFDEIARETDALSHTTFDALLNAATAQIAKRAYERKRQYAARRKIAQEREDMKRLFEVFEHDAKARLVASHF